MGQPKAWRRHSALVLPALGIGAGLRAGEMALVETNDVVGGTRSLRVRVALAPSACNLTMRPCLLR